MYFSENVRFFPVIQTENWSANLSFSDTLLKNDTICHTLFYEQTDSRKFCWSLFQSIHQLVQSSAVLHNKKNCKYVNKHMTPFPNY